MAKKIQTETKTKRETEVQEEEVLKDRKIREIGAQDQEEQRAIKDGKTAAGTAGVAGAAAGEDETLEDGRRSKKLPV